MFRTQFLAAFLMCAAATSAACGDDNDKPANDTLTTNDIDTPDTDTPVEDVQDVGEDMQDAGEDVQDAGEDVQDAGEDVEDAAEDLQEPDVATLDTTSPVENFMGQTYVQRLGLGYASYHFEAPDDVYVSYANAENLGWTLESGALPPERKPFTDISFDYASRTFARTVDWEDDPQTGIRRLDYNMKFSSDFLSIESGLILLTRADGSQSTVNFGVDIFYRAVTATDPCPFAVNVDCMERPFPSDKVVYVGVFEDVVCTAPTGTVIALPVESTSTCCDGGERLDASLGDFACDGGNFSFSMAYDQCVNEPTGVAATVSNETCAPFSLLGNLRLKVLPHSNCVR